MTLTSGAAPARLWALYAEAAAGDAGAQPLLLQIGLLHQPVGEAAQQLGLRAAALEAARPQPQLVAHHLGDAALVDAVEDQQRLVADAAHEHLAVARHRLDLAEPTAPPALGAEGGGHRMAAARLREPRPEAPLDHPTRGLGRHHGAERRVEEAAQAGELGTDGKQQRAAGAQVSLNIAQVRGRQHVAHRVTVEDDEVEFVELDLEQLAYRKDDQRQLLEGREIVLLGGPQDGEMHQVHRRIRLQQVAPRALPRMGLAGHQEDPEPVAHGVDAGGGAVVEGRELAVGRLDLELHDARPGVLEGKGKALAPSHRHQDGLGLAAIPPEAHPGLARHPFVRRRRAVLDAEGDVDVLADDAVARRLFDDQTAVRLAALPAQQDVQGTRQRRRLGGGRYIMDLPVGDHDGAGEAPGGHVGQGAAKCVEQPRALLGGPGPSPRRADNAHLEIGEARKIPAEDGKRLPGLGLSRAHLLASALVDDDHRHVGPRHPVFADGAGIEEGQDQNAQRQGAPPRPPGAAHHADGDQGRGEEPQGGQQRPWHQGRETQASAHCPSLRRMAGRCT